MEDDLSPEAETEMGVVVLQAVSRISLRRVHWLLQAKRSTIDTHDHGHDLAVAQHQPIVTMIVVGPKNAAKVSPSISAKALRHLGLEKREQRKTAMIDGSVVDGIQDTTNTATRKQTAITEAGTRGEAETREM